MEELILLFPEIVLFAAWRDEQRNVSAEPEEGECVGGLCRGKGLLQGPCVDATNLEAASALTTISR